MEIKKVFGDSIYGIFCFHKHYALLFAFNAVACSCFWIVSVSTTKQLQQMHVFETTPLLQRMYLGWSVLFFVLACAWGPLYCYRIQQSEQQRACSWNELLEQHAIRTEMTWTTRLYWKVYWKWKVWIHGFHPEPTVVATCASPRSKVRVSGSFEACDVFEPSSTPNKCRVFLSWTGFVALLVVQIGVCWLTLQQETQNYITFILLSCLLLFVNQIQRIVAVYSTRFEGHARWSSIQRILLIKLFVFETVSVATTVCITHQGIWDTHTGCVWTLLTRHMLVFAGLLGLGEPVGNFVAIYVWKHVLRCCKRGSPEFDLYLEYCNRSQLLLIALLATPFSFFIGPITCVGFLLQELLTRQRLFGLCAKPVPTTVTFPTHMFWMSIVLALVALFMYPTGMFWSWKYLAHTQC